MHSSISPFTAAASDVCGTIVDNFGQHGRGGEPPVAATGSERPSSHAALQRDQGKNLAASPDFRRRGRLYDSRATYAIGDHRREPNPGAELIASPGLTLDGRRCRTGDRGGEKRIGPKLCDWSGNDKKCRDCRPIAEHSWCGDTVLQKRLTARRITSLTIVFVVCLGNRGKG